ncbi:MAG: hypothetical protein HQL70_10725 [Magnetococcales bacterium]|nr:hypothetical protein [Magnetococcales bacterium]
MNQEIAQAIYEQLPNLGLIAQHIDLSSEPGKIEINLLAIILFFGLPGESRGRASGVQTTIEYRLKEAICQKHLGH